MTLRTPWEVVKNSQYPALYDVYDCDGNPIAQMKVFEVANAIAAAPELLAALELIKRNAQNAKPYEAEYVLGVIEARATMTPWPAPAPT